MKTISLYMLVPFALFLLMMTPDSVLSAPAGAGLTSAYNEAGALYRGGKFPEALAKYEQLLKSGVRNPDLYYNAANAAYRANSIGKSVLYLERARKLAPSDPDILGNLAYVNSRKTDKEPVDTNAVTAFLSSHYDAININSAALWSGTTFLLMMLLAVGILFSDRWKRIVFISLAGVCALLFVVSTGVLVQKAHRSAAVVEAVVMNPEVNAFSGPGSENTHIFTLHEGTVVFQERRQDAWTLIRLKSGIAGWVSSGSIEAI